jgi:hypothetical protein
MAEKEKRLIYDIYLDSINGVELPVDEYRRLIAFYESNRSITEYKEPETPEVRGVGRPPRYISAADMQVAIDEYFNAHQPKLKKDQDGIPVTTAKGSPVYDMNPPTISGLALFLGFVNRQSLYDYENRNDEFSDTVKKARTRCENFIETGGITGEVPAPMAIFALKNYGWSDKQEFEHTGKDGSPLFNDDAAKAVMEKHGV